MPGRVATGIGLPSGEPAPDVSEEDEPGMMTPDAVARRILAAVGDDQLYLFTHEERMEDVEARFAAGSSVAESRSRAPRPGGSFQFSAACRGTRGSMSEQRVAIVTGGGSGIGLGISRRLASDGMAVVVVDLDGDTADSAAGVIGAAGGTVMGVAGGRG